MNPAILANHNQLTAPLLLCCRAAGPWSFLTWLLVMLMDWWWVSVAHWIEWLLSAGLLIVKTDANWGLSHDKLLCIALLLYTHVYWKSLWTLYGISYVLFSLINFSVSALSWARRAFDRHKDIPTCKRKIHWHGEVSTIVTRIKCKPSCGQCRQLRLLHVAKMHQLWTPCMPHLMILRMWLMKTKQSCVLKDFSQYLKTDLVSGSKGVCGRVTLFITK